MGKIARKPSLDEYDEGVTYFLNKKELSATELSDNIENRLGMEPDRGSKEYKVYRRNVNKLIDLFNSNFGKVWKRVL